MVYIINMSEQRPPIESRASNYKGVAVLASFVALLSIGTAIHEHAQINQQAQQIETLKNSKLDMAEAAPLRAAALAEYLNQNSASQQFKYLPVFNGTINEKKSPQKVMWFSPIVLNDK